ncbi:MAG TPA: hypothetical protein VH560_00610 [Polyangia bacterium]|nr:hypothetical protein [Polyangia bacterium]
MRRRAALIAVVALIALGVMTNAARAAAPAAPVSGFGEATNRAGQVFRGAWSADIALATPDVAVGTWTLVDDHGNRVMGGTWSARQARRGWHGAWSARVAATNAILSGTWDADDRTLAGAKTFDDLLRRTAEKQIAGVWRLGRARGDWWLSAAR